MMPLFMTLLAVMLLPTAQPHNTMGIFLVNNTETPPWKYVRDVAFLRPETWPNKENEFPKTPPQEDIHHPDITCGRNAFASASKTGTATVIAGSEVGFRVSWDGNGKGGVFWHPGPAQAYLSRAPNDDIKSYKGDGDWFKVAWSPPKSNQEWPLWGEHDWNFTIPRTTPPGKYLLRIEQFMPTASWAYTQWYVNCAQVKIVGPGGGTPKGFAKFPGTYEVDDIGLFVPLNQEQNGGFVKKEELRLLDYKPPGPAVWIG